jgi:hypothetical protein
MEAILNLITNNPFWVGVFLLFVLWSVSSTITTMHATRQRERSRREIAAYVAEGSMSPKDGERLLKANSPSDPDEC